MPDRGPCWRGRLGKGEEGESNHGGASAQAVQELPLDRRRSGTSGRQARRSRNPVLRVFHLVVYVRGHDRRGHRGNLRPPPARRYARGNAAQGLFDDEEPTSVTLCTGRIMAHSETGTSACGATRRLLEQLIPRSGRDPGYQAGRPGLASPTTLAKLKCMPLCRYALAVCLCAAAAARAEQQPAPPDAEMNSAIEEFKAQPRSLGLRADSPPKAGRHSPLLDWHGRVFENFRNDALDAVPHEIRQNGGNKGLLRRNQFGFNVAGPAVLPHLAAGRNTYFSLSYEGVREDIARTYLQTIPTMAQRTGDYSDVVDAAGGKIAMVETVTRGSATLYEATYTDKGGKKHEFAVKADGVETKDRKSVV